MQRVIPAGASRREFILPLFFVCLGLIHGLLYLFLIPPWQHYDEPTQFEFAWLLANRKGFPTPGDYDQEMRREVAASMIEFNFFKHLGFRPNLLSHSEPVWIGISQTGDSPLYYLLVSFPLQLVKGTDITFQLTLARMVSLLLYLVSIVACYGVIAELTPPGHPLRWLAPLVIVLLPGYTELMTAVNNDVGATAFFSLFLWVSVIMVRRGFSWIRLGGLILLTLMCLYTKTTVAAAVLLAPIPVLFSIFPTDKRKPAWFLFAAAAVGMILLCADWGDAFLWYRLHTQTPPTREKRSDTPLGSYAFHLSQIPGQPSAQLFQLISRNDTAAIRGKKVTLGAWLWASQPMNLPALALMDGHQSFSEQIDIGDKPAFVAIPAQVDKDATSVSVYLVLSGAQEGPINLYADGVVLAQGDRPLDKGPNFNDLGAQAGSWGGKPFRNLIRNASAENAWFRLRPKVEQLLRNKSPIIPSLVMTSLVDRPGSGWYYSDALKAFLQTFWGEFGWAHIRLLGRYTYLALAVFTLINLAGVSILLIRRWRAMPKEILFLLGTASLVLWGAALFRGLSSLYEGQWLPSARYAYPVIIPSVLLINAGGLELLRPFQRLKRLPAWIPYAIYLCFFLALDILSIVSIVHYYQAG